jgi:hypothetical protein
MYNAYKKSHPYTIRESMTEIHVIIIKVVVSQSEMSHFVIMIDVASTTLQPLC